MPYVIWAYTVRAENNCIIAFFSRWITLILTLSHSVSAVIHLVHVWKLFISLESLFRYSISKLNTNYTQNIFIDDRHNSFCFWIALTLPMLSSANYYFLWSFATNANLLKRKFGNSSTKEGIKWKNFSIRANMCENINFSLLCVFTLQFNYPNFHCTAFVLMLCFTINQNVYSYLYFYWKKQSDYRNDNHATQRKIYLIELKFLS